MIYSNPCDSYLVHIKNLTWRKFVVIIQLNHKAKNYIIYFISSQIYFFIKTVLPFSNLNKTIIPPHSYSVIHLSDRYQVLAIRTNGVQTRDVTRWYNLRRNLDVAGCLLTSHPIFYPDLLEYITS